MLEFLLGTVLVLVALCLFIAVFPFLVAGAAVAFCLIMALITWVKEKLTQ